MEPEIFILLSTVLAYLVCQFIKLAADKDKKKQNIESFFLRKGGIVSSHSATMISLIVAIYLTESITPLLIASIIFSALIITEIWKDDTNKTGRHNFREILLGTVVGELLTLTLFIFFYL